MPRAVLLVVMVSALGWTLAAQRGAAGRADGEWRYYAGDAASTKYSPLDQITGDNVSRLEVAWRWSSPDNAIVQANPAARPGAYQDTPLMVNGVLYTTTSLGVYAAIDPGTGTTLWQYDPQVWKLGRPPNLGFTHRGTAYWTDGTKRRLISGTHDAYLISVDAETGTPDLAFGDSGRADVIAGLPFAERVRNYAINSTPVIVKNVIIAGSNINDVPFSKEAPRGDLFGFDVVTGRKLWTFHAIPQPGEFGHDTWEADGASYTGNTNVWSMMSVDEALGYVYLPFGTPTSDYYGGHRLGQNLFAESLVCLDATTGKRVWHFQAVHHGLWDYDFPAAPILGDLTVNGRQVQAVMQVSKQGFVYAFDRRTGQPLWPIEERPAPPSDVPGEKASATQPFPTRPPAFDLQGFPDSAIVDFTPELRARAIEVLTGFVRGPLFTPPSEKGTIQIPGNVGGADWGGAGFDPETGHLFVPSITSPIVDQLVKVEPERGNLAYRRGGTQNLPTLDGIPLYKPPYSRVTAYDMNTGSIAWQVPIGDGPRDHPLLKDLQLGALGNGQRGSPLVTKGVLFVSQASGGLGRGETLTVGDRPLSRLAPEPQKFRAFNKTSGALLWERALSTGPAGAPMTYLYRGRQYVVLATGSGPNAELVAYALPNGSR